MAKFNARLDVWIQDLARSINVVALVMDIGHGYWTTLPQKKTNLNALLDGLIQSSRFRVGPRVMIIVGRLRDHRKRRWFASEPSSCSSSRRDSVYQSTYDPCTRRSILNDPKNTKRPRIAMPLQSSCHECSRGHHHPQALPQSLALLVECFPIIRYLPRYITELEEWRREESQLFHDQLDRVPKQLATGEAGPSFSRYLLENQPSHKLSDEEMA
ncbi:hypothetical protein EV424DRAFT_367543 [Suillus variegatus]|nr:hypothetical protein EV424DRAFT_367543 [Suillus variegatus]